MKRHKELLTCQICGKQVKNLGQHLYNSHKEFTAQSYYDFFIKKDGEGICPICGKPTTFKTIRKGYSKHCSAKCAQIDTEVRAKQEATNLEKYNTKYSITTEQVKEKIKQTKKERYGDENYNNIQKMKQTKKEKYGNESYVNPEKAKETNMNRYGVTVASKLESIKEKQRQTCQELYGVDSYLQKPEVKQAFQEKYNSDHPMHVESIYNKVRQTNKETYGYECSFQSREVRLKALQNMKQNGNRSSLEDYLEQFFIDNNINYQQEYKEKRYPYFCDFYLPDTDTFIEINNYWTHGRHWFDETNQNDLDTIELWKQKASEGHKQYQSAIHIWTELDVEKRNCAKQNSINYIVLWNKKDIDEFIMLYKI